MGHRSRAVGGLGRDQVLESVEEFHWRRDVDGSTGDQDAHDFCASRVARPAKRSLRAPAGVAGQPAELLGVGVQREPERLLHGVFQKLRSQVQVNWTPSRTTGSCRLSPSCQLIPRRKRS